MKKVVGFVALLALVPSSMLAQAKNEIGLVIGGTVTPSQTLSTGASLIGPGRNVLSSRDLTFGGSLALGADYDRNLGSTRRVEILGGIDFLASPLDVKLNQRPRIVIPEYAYVFLTPHVRAKFKPNGALSPWLLFGGGYARFRESAPPTVPSFKAGTNKGTFEIGGGIDTRTVLHILRIPIAFRIEVRDFYSGTPNYNQTVSSSLQNNLAFTGGLLIKF